LACALALCGAEPSPVLAQLTLPTGAPTAPGGVRQVGLYTTAPIVLDGTFLFRIAGPNDQPSDQDTLAARVARIQATLAQLIATTGSGDEAGTVYDPESLRIDVEPERDVDVLAAVDRKHTDPLPVLTVTTVDALYNQSDVDTLARQWQPVLQAALRQSLELRQPAQLHHNLTAVVRLALILLAATLLSWFAFVKISRRSERLAKELETQAREAKEAGNASSPEATDAHRNRRRFLAIAIRGIEPQEQINLYRALSEAIVWSLLLAWFIAITWSFSLFPQTTIISQHLVHGAFGIATTVLVTGLLNRVLDIAIARAAKVWRFGSFTSSEDRARQLLRIPTIARALAGLKTFLLIFVAVLTILGQLGVPIGSVVTIGGLAAIGLSLAAQNLVRDVANGFLILFEDQYVVGDYVTLNGAAGIVERLSLRMTQLRDASGNLVTISHSAVTSVANQSRNWSRVDFRVPVDPASDVDRAVEIVRTTISNIATEAAYQAAILEPLEWIGIDALSKDAAIVRASLKTAPLRQFELHREITARVHRAFVEGGIVLGTFANENPSVT
jgi:small conductance mechanosensitive channel